MSASNANDKQAWILIAASSTACAIGSCFIYLDVVWRRISPGSRFDLKHNNRVLVGGFSLGAGVLLFTALNRILPKAQDLLHRTHKFGNKHQRKRTATAVTMAAFLSGTILCILLNSILHRLTPESIISCGEHDDRASHEHGLHLHNPPTVHAENTPLLRCASSTRKQRSSTFLRKCPESQTSDCAGFTRPCKGDKFCYRSSSEASTPVSGSRSASQSGTNGIEVSRDEFHGQNHVEDESQLIRGHHHQVGRHHHHVTQARHDLLRIGLQTSVAISLHKLPEGFITFVSTHRDSQLGFSIFLALAVHNVVEGFTIAFPLFLAIESRIKAFAIAVILGGCSQPLGAILGYIVARVQNRLQPDEASLDVAYGILFAVTAGFMAVISITSLMPQAIRHAPSDELLFSVTFFVGIGLIGFSGALVG
ncbi:Zinc transporter [Savitreella phatthalungensis]